MSGHSKWSKVKHQKATTDVVKAKNFTKASRALMVSVREGGGIADPNSNFKLRLAIEKAREVNMPKETIERAIAKARGEGTESFESLLYEAIGPHGVALLIEAATENRQRTVSQLKNVLERNGGVLAAPGSVTYQFTHMGVIVITPKSGMSQDELLTLGLEVGAEDVRFFDDVTELYTDATKLEAAKKALEEKGIAIDTAELIYRPITPITLSDQENEQVETFLDMINELDDIQKIATNLS